MNVIDAKFVKYFNDFYGPNGIYPDKGRSKPITKQEIEKGFQSLLKSRGGDYTFEGDSMDRELIRDEMIDMNLINPDYSQKESRKIGNKSQRRVMLENRLRAVIRPIVLNILKNKK